MRSTMSTQKTYRLIGDKPSEALNSGAMESGGPERGRPARLNAPTSRSAPAGRRGWKPSRYPAGETPAPHVPSAQPHRHHHVEERPVDLQHAGAEFVNQLEKHLVLGQRVQRINDVGGIERHGHFLALVVDRHRLARFADIRRVCGDGQRVLAKGHLHRVLLVARHQFCAAQSVEKFFARQGDAFLRLCGNDLPVVRIVALDQLADDEHARALLALEREGRLVLREIDFQVAGLLQRAREFVHGLGRNDELALAFFLSDPEYPVKV